MMMTCTCSLLGSSTVILRISRGTYASTILCALAVLQTGKADFIVALTILVVYPWVLNP